MYTLLSQNATAPLQECNTKKTLIIVNADDCTACAKFNELEHENIIAYVEANYADKLNLAYIEKSSMRDEMPTSMAYINFDYEGGKITHCKINPSIASRVKW